MKPIMYIFLNSELRMSTGKAAAQAAHAAVEAYNLSRADLINAWYQGGHYTKVVLDGGDALKLLSIDNYLKARGFKVSLIIDEGRTEIDSYTPTALGVEILNKDDEHVLRSFEGFRTFKQRPNGTETKPKQRRSPWARWR